MKTIRYILFFCISTLCLSACHTPTKQETVPQENIDTFIDSAVNRTQDSMISPGIYELKFKSGLEYKIQNLNTALDAAKNSSDIAKVYAQALSVQSDLNESISQQYIKEKIAKNDSLKTLFSNTCDTFAAHSKLFSFTYVAEATEPHFIVSNEAFLKLSHISRQIDDDEFFELLIEIYGKNGEMDISFPVWITQTTDYSGYMELGDLRVNKLLVKIAKMAKGTTQFESYLFVIYDDIVDDILTYKKFANTKTATLYELEQIVKDNVILSDEDHDRVRQRMDDISSGIKDKQIEYNCKNGNCHYE